MSQAILEPAELDTLITDLEERISEVRLAASTPAAGHSVFDCDDIDISLICSIICTD